MIQPRSTGSTSSSSSSGSGVMSSAGSRSKKASACLPSSASALLLQSLFGNDCYPYLSIDSRSCLRHFQPPETPEGSWKQLRQPFTEGQASLASASAAVQKSKQARRYGAVGESALSWLPVDAAPARVDVLKPQISTAESRRSSRSSSSDSSSTTSNAAPSNDVNISFVSIKSQQQSRRLPASPASHWTITGQVLS